ncbi:MAG: cell envelope integrity protein TolA [Gammaproteobacteria bacterium]|jgi:colicin import membrane protein
MKNNFYKKSFVFAAVLYVTAFMVLFGSLNFKNHLRTAVLPNSSPKIVHATAVNQRQIQQQINKIKAERQAKHRAEIARQKHLIDLARQAKQQRIAEQRRLIKLKEQQNKIAQQQKYQAALAKKKLVQMQQRQQRMQQHLAELKKRNLDTQTEVEKQLQQEIAAKQQQIAAVQTKQELTEINKYRSLIINVIEQNWIIPSKIDKNLSAQLLINLAPGGTVLGVKILKSSGNVALDNSAVTAVWKSSPLPVPSAVNIFNQMRKLHLTVRPEGYVNDIGVRKNGVKA